MNRLADHEERRLWIESYLIAFRMYLSGEKVARDASEAAASWADLSVVQYRHAMQRTAS